jgi:8-oxo-dGTP pyrophosphatase MutT (NUDIX family)
MHRRWPDLTVSHAFQKAALPGGFFVSNAKMALSFDPQELPVASVDSHLPAVESDQLSADAMRRRFVQPPVWSPEIAVERQFSERRSTHASVLVPLVQRDEGPSVLLTQRTDHLTDHPGQVSFPGGRAALEDADAVATALREAEEEIGLSHDRVDVIGQLPTYTTGTGFIVTPVVGLIQPGFELCIDPFEVAEVFEVPLIFLMNPANHRWHAVEMGGVTREFLSMPWIGIDSAGKPRRYFVWGATAAMLRNLYRFLIA